MNISIYGALTIEVLEDCNLHCDVCMRGENTHKRISKSVVERIFDNVKYVRTLVLSGGEVTLAYDEIKMIIEVIKEKNVRVDSYQITVNGTIYNKRLFDLLRENFDRGYISISCDYFHDKSIKEIYKDPNKVLENMARIMREPHFDRLYGIPKTLINEGRCKNVDDVLKEETCFLPFVTIIMENTNLCVGPEVAIDVEGYLINPNSTYEKNSNNTLGNIFDSNLSDLIIKHSIKNDFRTFRKFITTKRRIEKNYFKRKKDSYAIEDCKVVKKDKVEVSGTYDKSIYIDSDRLLIKYLKQRKG